MYESLTLFHNEFDGGDLVAKYNNIAKYHNRIIRYEPITKEEAFKIAPPMKYEACDPSKEIPNSQSTELDIELEQEIERFVKSNPELYIKYIGLKNMKISRELFNFLMAAEITSLYI